MDENNVQRQPQATSEFDGEKPLKNESCALPMDKRICLVGEVVDDSAACKAAQTFGVPVITSETGLEFIEDKSCVTVYILDKFEGPLYEAIHKSNHKILGATALKQIAELKEPLPDNTRPLYNLSMRGVVVCFTGFRKKEELTRMIPLIHHMGGSIRKEMALKVTHLIANVSGGDKYQYAFVFRVPVMSASWVQAAWDNRSDMVFKATEQDFQEAHKLQPFYGTKVCFVGFSTEETQHMKEVLEANGGTLTDVDDPLCNYVVMDDQDNLTQPHITQGPSCCTPKTIPNPSFPSDEVDADQLETLEPISEMGETECNVKLESPLKRKRDETDISKVTENSFKFDFDVDPKATPILKVVKKRRLSITPRFTDILKTPIALLTPHRKSKIDESCISPTESLENLSISKNCSTPLTNEVEDSFCFSEEAGRGKKSRKSLRKPKLMRKLIGLDVETINESDKVERELNKQSGDEMKSGFMSSQKKTILKRHSICVVSSEHNLPSPSVLSDFSRLPPSGQQTLLEPRWIQKPVVDESAVVERPEINSRAYIVKAEWFWASVQNAACVDGKDYLFDTFLEKLNTPSRQESNIILTPSSAPGGSARRKRKRLHGTLGQLVRGASITTGAESPGLHGKRRSSVSDAGLLSVSGSFLDCTTSPDKSLLDEPEGVDQQKTSVKKLSPRQMVFIELVQTESNYVNILDTIMTMFKSHLEKMPKEEALLNHTELKIIFGNLPPIYETHKSMLEELRNASLNWTEDTSVGNIVLKYAKDLTKAYPPFVNYFETMKDMLVQCDTNKPRFHAFLKVCQTKPECGRQSLQELLIRPVQRLPSISLLLGDILKHTSKNNPDHSALEKALAAIREVMTHINEDKRKTEGQLVMFDVFNEIDNCPPHLVSSHRSFVSRCEVQELSDGLSGRGDMLVLFLFTDMLEVCKKRSKYNSLKSPNTINGHVKVNSSIKPYKHVRLMPLSTIKQVINIRESDECHNGFALRCRNNQELKEKIFSFIMTDEDVIKLTFLRMLCRQMANTVCQADAETFLVTQDSQELDIDTSDIALGTFSKAFKFANRTRMKVGRAFSFNKTPSKLKRAVSTMMSPFGSSTNLTPASQLAQMRLASCNNINELGNNGTSESSTNNELLVAPMSVQPTRKTKCTSLGAAALRRL